MHNEEMHHGRAQPEREPLSRRSPARRWIQIASMAEWSSDLRSCTNLHSDPASLLCFLGDLSVKQSQSRGARNSSECFPMDHEPKSDQLSWLSGLTLLRKPVSERLPKNRTLK